MTTASSDIHRSIPSSICHNVTGQLSVQQQQQHITCFDLLSVISSSIKSRSSSLIRSITQVLFTLHRLLHHHHLPHGQIRVLLLVGESLAAKKFSIIHVDPWTNPVTNDRLIASRSKARKLHIWSCVSLVRLYDRSKRNSLDHTCWSNLDSF